MFNLLHDHRLCRALNVSFRGANGEIREKGRLPISTFAVEIPANEISRLLVDGKE